MQSVEGIILIISCQRHQHTRLPKYGLQEKEFEGWKIYKVIGNLTIGIPYKLEENLITINCEDSYFHLMKKTVLAIKILNEMYDIKQGILKLGDDLLINKENLSKFLKIQKTDYMGKPNISFNRNINNLGSMTDNFMMAYYKTHLDDFKNPMHGLKNVNVRMYRQRPDISYIVGVAIYLSKKACNILVDHMKKRNFNILHKERKGYPYVVEDVGIGYILLINKIKPTLFTLYDEKNTSPNAIGFHTNENR